MNDDVSKGLENTEKLIEMFSIDGYSVGKRLTWADLFVSIFNYHFLGSKIDMKKYISSK